MESREESLLARKQTCVLYIITLLIKLRMYKGEMDATPPSLWGIFKLLERAFTL